MTTILKGWNQKLMLSLHKKEASYGAAVTVNSTNFCGIKGHTDFNPDIADNLMNDKDTVSGYEHGTEQEITSYGFKYAPTTPHVTPNLLIGGVALCLGDISSTKDGANDAYTHKVIEVADGAAIPSINAIGVKGGIQQLYKGIKGGGFEIKGEEDKPVSFTLNTVGSGSRATNADSFIAPVSESWIMTNPTKIWLESGTDIAIDATPIQGTQSISSGTPDDVSSLIKSYTIKYDGKLDEQRMGGAGYASDIHYGRRSYQLTLAMRFSDYMTLYENQTVIALEFDCAGGSKIDADGSLYFGFKIIIPKVRLAKPPRPEGGVNDTVTMNFECDVEEDGTNKPFIFYGYNAVAAYLAP